MSAVSGLIFTIDIDGKPTVAFEATTLRETHELSREEWLRADLSVHTISGAPLATKTSKLKARIARPEELATPEREQLKESRTTIWNLFISSNSMTLQGLSRTTKIKIGRRK